MEITKEAVIKKFLEYDKVFGKIKARMDEQDAKIAALEEKATAAPTKAEDDDDLF